MRHHPGVQALLAALLWIAGLPPASADIYTWVDAQGRVNISNLEPPEGARVTKVVRETPPHANPYNDAAREAARKAEQQAELTNLAQRVEQLQGELAVARQPPPVQPQIVVVPVVTPVQYAAEPAPVVEAPDCSWGWGGFGWNGFGCNGGWGLGFAPFVSYAYAVPARPPRGPIHGGRGHGERPMPHGRGGYTGWTSLVGLADIGSIAAIGGNRGSPPVPSPKPVAPGRR